MSSTISPSPESAKANELSAVLASLDGVIGPDSSGNYRAICPVDREVDNPSLSIKRSAFGAILFKCFRDCAAGDIEAAIEARRAKGERRGVIPDTSERRALSKDDTFAIAMRLWLQTKPAEGTPVETYLRRRGIKIKLPPTLRSHPNLKHQSGGYYPAMLAIVVDADGHAVGVHRTFLTADGRKAKVGSVKMALGPVSGGAVRLVATKAIPKKLAIAEGIETALSVAQMNPGLNVWAALSTSGMRNLIVPAGVEEIVICSDGDDAGSAAARYLQLRMQDIRRVRVVSAPDGQDFNDILPFRRKHVKV